MWAIDKIYSAVTKEYLFRRWCWVIWMSKWEKKIPMSHYNPKSISNGSWIVKENENKNVSRIEYVKISF